MTEEGRTDGRDTRPREACYSVLGMAEAVEKGCCNNSEASNTKGRFISADIACSVARFCVSVSPHIPVAQVAINAA